MSRRLPTVPAFTQIAAASITDTVRDINGQLVPILSSVLYALDRNGRIWRKLPSARGIRGGPNKKWTLVEPDAEEDRRPHCQGGAVMAPIDYGLCEYCRKALGYWNDEAGYICGACHAGREIRKQAELDRYDERESNP